MSRKKGLSLSEMYTLGKENLEKSGIKLGVAPDSDYGASVKANRRCLDSIFFIPRYFDPVEPDTSLPIFGRILKTPAYCSAISRPDYMSAENFLEVIRGVSQSGAMIMLGIGGSKELQYAIDTRALVVKMVKPYRQTELIYKKAHDAESRGCVAIGMDIDHFYGALRETTVLRDEIFGPQKTEEIKQLISQTRLPFIIKGVLSTYDAEKAVEIGASAVIVSNHGRGGAINFSIPAIVALPQIVASVGDRVPVFIDSGFKTGNDILKALALGAKAVGFGNSILLGYAAGGADGVSRLLDRITDELRRTMASTGCASLTEVSKTIISALPSSM